MNVDGWGWGRGRVSSRNAHNFKILASVDPIYPWAVCIKLYPLALLFEVMIA